jgi:hypothetical protein
LHGQRAIHARCRGRIIRDLRLEFDTAGADFPRNGERYTDPAHDRLMLNHDVSTTQTWYRRMFQVPIIEKHVAVHSDTEAARIKKSNPTWTALGPAAFREKFYAGEPSYVPADRPRSAQNDL